MEIYELKPNNNTRKSFYGKANVIESKGLKLLRSYETIVCYFDKKGKLHRTYEFWSVTTGRHIASFCNLGKKDFEKLPVEKVPNF